MDNPIDGSVKPALCEINRQGQKTRTYKKPNGEVFEITEDEFNQIVAIFYFFRGQKNNDTQAECIEPNPEGSNLEQNEIQSRKAG